MATKNQERKRILEEEKKLTDAKKVMRRSTIEDWTNLSEEDFKGVTEFVCERKCQLSSNGAYPRELIVEAQKLKVESLEEDFETVSSELSQRSKEAEEKQKEIDELQKQLNELKAQIKKKEEQLRKIEKAEEKALEKSEKIDKELKEALDVLRKMDDIVCFHRTATLLQVHKNQYERIYVTEADSAMFSMLDDRTGGVFSIDEVCDATENESFVTEFPNDFFFKYSEKERESIVEYCEMLINLKMREDGERKVIPAFCNNAIIEILKLNGLEDFKE